MNSPGEIPSWLIITVAFIGGYVIISLLIRKLRGTSTDREATLQKPDPASADDPQRRRLEEMFRQQERAQREIEMKRSAEDQRRPRDFAESNRQTTSNRRA